MVSEKKEDERIYWIWLQNVLGCGSHRVNTLAARFDSPRAIQEMSARDLAESRCFTPAEIDRIGKARLEEASAVLCRCEAIGVRVVTPQDDEYPERLRNIYAMPAALYVRGNLSGLDHELAITMVGTRKCSEYGLRCAELLARQLSECGASVASGCALGIDTAALHGAIRHSGKVIGVLGNGLDVAYPASNENMLRWMGETQRLISEYPPGMRPLRRNFPVRNRILAAISVGTVVVEAPRGSGALITANHALEQGKDIFAVPGRIDDPLSAGALDLIRQGAKPVCGVEDILSEYERLYPAQIRRFEEGRLKPRRPENRCPAAPDADGVRPDPEGLDNEQLKVYRCLSRDPIPAQAISQRTGMPVSRLLPILTELEISGCVVSLSGGRYSFA